MTPQEIANFLDDAAYTAQPVEQISLKNNITLEDAYKIQRLSIEARKKRGEKVTGYKMGFTSYAKMEQMGVHDLIWGILTDQMQIIPKEEVNLNQWIHPRAEPEIAFHVKKAINKPITLDEIPEYIDKMAAAIEVIDSRYKNFKFTLEDVVADNCSSTGYVRSDWKELKVEGIDNLKIDLWIDGKKVESGNTAAILKNPLQSVVELSRLANEAGVVVEEGHIIMAGAATAAVYLNPGNNVASTLEGVGEIGFKVAK